MDDCEEPEEGELSMLNDVLEVNELKDPVEKGSVTEPGVDSSEAVVGEANVAVVLPELHPEGVETDEEEGLMICELGDSPAMEEDVDIDSDTDVGREMRDEAIDADVKGVGKDEAEYKADEDGNGVVADVFPLDGPAWLDADFERLKAVSYVCVSDDDGRFKEVPRAALEKLLSELSADEPFEMGVE